MVTAFSCTLIMWIMICKKILFLKKLQIFLYFKIFCKNMYTCFLLNLFLFYFLATDFAVRFFDENFTELSSFKKTYSSRAKVVKLYMFIFFDNIYIENIQKLILTLFIKIIYGFRCVFMCNTSLFVLHFVNIILCIQFVPLLCNLGFKTVTLMHCLYKWHKTVIKLKKQNLKSCYWCFMLNSLFILIHLYFELLNPLNKFF